ncbi:zinc finger protein 525 [Zeugodacus cucurbitae]|uniref:Putative zinc finger protein 724 n=1 Tax=Zeugodacus cucurbitae TaxID=28588 RepID=A0A0A1WMB0_ZEUCU|nr:zinc finger protein 525 [Zeugodacus cucurbitae]
MRETLHVCGKILTTDDYHFFALCCEKCDASFGQWSGFLKHLSNKHDLELPLSNTFIRENEQNPECDELTIKANLKQEMENELNKQMKVDAAEYESNDGLSDSETEVNTKKLETQEEFQDIDCASTKSDESTSGWNMAEDNNHLEDTSSEEELFQDSKKKLKSFNFNIHEAYTRDISNKFLKIIEKYPILWDQQHSNYWLPEKRTRVLFSIKEYMAKAGYTVSDYGLRSVIQRILRDHKAYKQELAVCGRLDEQKTLFLKKCKFLDGPQNGTGTTNEAENESDADDHPIPDDLDDDEFLMSSDIDSNAGNNSSEINAFLKESRDGKRICFNMTVNPLIDEFVSLLRDNPILWEVGQFQNLTERKRILESWIPIFQERHNVIFTYKDLTLNLKILRRTLTNMEERKVLAKSAQHLKDICSFLPKAKPITRLKCEECNRNFLTEYTLQAHKYAAHNIGTNPFKCEVCGRDFQAHNQLDTHLRRVHLKQFSVYCDVCNRGFLQHSAMVLHRQTHTGEKMFVCETCGKSFRRKINMQQHYMRIHLRQRNFNCELCPKTFYLKCHLRDHMNAHLNIRNHICPTCGKAFHSSHALMRHKQIHSEVKRYACKLCDARFHQFVGLNSHMKNKHKFVNDKDEEVQSQPVVHMTTLPATTTPDTSMQIKGEIVQSLDSWNM